MIRTSPMTPTRRRAGAGLAALLAATLAGGATLFGGAPAPAHAADKKAGLTAEAIIEKMIDADPLGYGGAEARILMVLVNNRNQENKRKVVMKSRKDDKTRRLTVRFLEPTDVAGTAFLGIDNDGERTQFLYLPEMAKTRRISGKQRNGSFVGTDYSYADLDNRDIDDSTKKRLADEKVGNQDCYVIEAVPTSGESEYGRVDLWISKESFLPVRIRFYDKKGTESKRLTVQEIKQVEKRWVITESKIVDLKREHTTVMKVTEIDLRNDIPLDQFSERALSRG
jgi:hypothetical protein